MKIRCNEIPTQYGTRRDPHPSPCTQKAALHVVLLDTEAKSGMAFLGAGMQPQSLPWLTSQELGSLEAKGTVPCPRSHGNTPRLSQRQQTYTTQRAQGRVLLFPMELVSTPSQKEMW